MSKYIYLKESNEVAGPIQNPPFRPHLAPPDWDIDGYIAARRDYEKHIAFLPRYKVIGTHHWGDQEILDLRDFTWGEDDCPSCEGSGYDKRITPKLLLCHKCMGAGSFKEVLPRRSETKAGSKDDGCPTCSSKSVRWNKMEIKIGHKDDNVAYIEFCLCENCGWRNQVRWVD